MIACWWVDAIQAWDSEIFSGVTEVMLFKDNRIHAQLHSGRYFTCMEFTDEPIGDQLILATK